MLRQRAQRYDHRDTTVVAPTPYSCNAAPLVVLSLGPETTFPMLYDDETPLAELERLRVENARLRAQIQHVAPSAAPRQPGQYPSPPVSADSGGMRTGQPRVSASRRWVGRALMGAMVVVALVTAALYARRVANSDFGHGVRDGWQEGK